MRVAEPFARLLLLTHHRRPSEAILDGAVELARLSKGRLTFARALEGADRIDGPSRRELLRELEALMTPHLDGYAADYRLMSGDPGEVMARSAGLFDLVVPAEGVPQTEAANLEIERLLRRSPMPVWLDSGDGRTPRGILAAVDVETRNPLKRALNLPVLRRAVRLASYFDARLDLLSVRTPLPAADLLARRLAGDREPAKPTRRQAREALRELLARASDGEPSLSREPRLMVAQGEPDTLIRQAIASASVDLLVAGCLGRSGLAAWLVGNTAERLSRQLPCSLLAVKQTPEQMLEHIGATGSKAA